MAVADGAGGISGGRRASELVLAACARAASDGQSHDLTGLLHSISAELQADEIAGESTAVVACVSTSGISGASVGDSEAWLISGRNVNVLTERQKRKPLLGTRRALPIPFFAQLGQDDVLLLGTDGLFKYVGREQLVDAVSNPTADVLGRVRSLVGLSSRQLPDDISMIVCRRIREPG